MIVFPKSLQEAAAATGTVRAGGTDLMERRRGLELVDLRDVEDGRAIEVLPGGAARIGALVPIAAIAAHDGLRASHPGLTAAAGGLATPQIRAVGTLGGNLLQRTRCWYYRSHEAVCLKKGGDQCFARAGDHLFHACFDLSPCASVHPSTLAMALLAYDATVDVVGAAVGTVGALIGDGGDPTRDHHLPPGAVLRSVTVPPKVVGERAAYMRAISRARAEWPLVEVLARVGVQGDAIAWAKVAVGGVAGVPLRLAAVEAALVGAPAQPEALTKAAKLARDGAEPLPMTGYKVDLLEASVLEALELALLAEPVR